MADINTILLGVCVAILALWNTYLHTKLNELLDKQNKL